ncbi:MAG: hypothetical protein AMJ53_17935, partial [Gammaproteobacteria bacterium SG8_11]
MNNKLKGCYLLTAVFIALVLNACQSDDDSPAGNPPARGDLVSGSLVASHSKSDINGLYMNTDLFGTMPALYDV